MFSQNFIYKENDWMLISNPGNISSMTIKNNDIIIASSTGIYIYDIENSHIQFMNEFIRGFSKKGNIIIHYDKYRDHLWYMTNEKIYFKSYISSIWREIEFNELGLGSSYVINNIGSDFNFIFLQVGSEYLILDPYTGKLVEYDENIFINEESIIWSSSSRDLESNTFHLNSLNSVEGFNIISNEYIEMNDRILTVSTILHDENNNVWVGTYSGEIFKCDLYLNTIQIIKNIPHFYNINYSFLDYYGEWWISTNENNIFDDNFVLNKEHIFLSRWDEYKNK